MDGDAGTQVAVHDSFGCGARPFYQYQFLPGRGYDSMYGSKQAAVSSRLNPNSEPSNRGDHNEAGANEQFKSRGWEGFSFMAHPDSGNGSCAGKPVKTFEKERDQRITPIDLRLDSTDNRDGDVAAELCSTEQRRKQSLFNNCSPTQQINLMRGEDNFDEDVGSLSLKLCPGSFSYTDDAGNGARNTKRFRSSSPGGQSPVCQVDDCRADLKHAKDYHRRHKVCEIHSKAPHSLVHKAMQRFCQQCSRFHPLQEFDEGKRSCRRRLAGHNKRRRKPHPDVGTNGVPMSEAVRGTDFLSIVAILSQLQSAKAKEKLDVPSIEQESILQGKKAALVPPLSMALIRDVTLAASQNSQTLPGRQRSDQESQPGVLSPLGGLSQEALLLVLRNFLGAQVSATQGKVQQPQVPQQLPCNDQSIHSLFSSHCQSSPDDLRKASDVAADQLPFALAGKLFKSHGDTNPSELSSRPNIMKQYLGHTSSYSVEADPDSPPDRNDTRSPAEQNFFPTESGSGLRNGEASRANRAVHNAESPLLEDDLNLSAFKQQHGTPLVAYKPSRQPSDSSESGSDQSPASSSSGGQELSGRIIFKLCDPTRLTDIPQNHRSQLQKWLSVTPWFMEGYMRPGCILLSVFVSMPHRSWEELVANLRGSLKRLVRLSHGDMWTKGRILVQVEQQRALIINGKVKKIRFSRANNVPLLRSVRPLAVVAGQETTLVVCGYNLVPQTRILCVYHGRYVLHEVPLSACEDTHDDSSSSSSGRGDFDKQVQRIHFPGGPPNVLGRCFIEVEHDLLGNILPVIVADKAICSELRSLEEELGSDSSWQPRDSEDFSSDEVHMNKEAEAMNFLHELGWIFQSTSLEISPCSVDVDPSSHISLSRFKGLLKYAVLRDWCAVVKKLLDLLFSIGIKEIDEVLHILSEVNLVHQAVKRKCRLMVELLLRYLPDGDGLGGYRIFTPVMKGPAGFTPLHIAASISDAEDILEALTDDPSEVGLLGWKSVHDYAGRTPEWHAQNSGNLSYLRLIERKISTKQSPSVSVTILNVAQISACRDSIEGNDLSAARMGIVAEQDIILVELPTFSRRTASSSAQVCRDCRTAARLHPFRSSRAHRSMHRPLMMMMVAVAALCATVTLLFKTPPHLESIFYSLKWDGIMSGPL